MASWSNDEFYSRFPSYSHQITRKEALAKARQADYQVHLDKQRTPKVSTDGKAQKRHTSNEGHSKRPKLPVVNAMKPVYQSPGDKMPMVAFETNYRVDHKNRFLDELEQADLPDIFNEKAINQRNAQMAEERRLRSIRNKQDLMAQIEQKQRERDFQKAKEREDEERSTKRMEEQLRMVRLQDKIESQRHTRRRELINVQLDKPMAHHIPKPPTTVRSEQLGLAGYRLYEDEQKARSERDKENWEALKRHNDKGIYNYFTNSARNHNNLLKQTRYNHYIDLEDVSENEILPNSMSSTTSNTYPLKSVRHQEATANHPNQQHACNRIWSQNPGANGYMCECCKPVCSNCGQEMVAKCNGPRYNDNELLSMPAHLLKQRNREASVPIHPVAAKPRARQQVFTDDDDSQSDLSSTEHQPFSFNIDEASIFHPSNQSMFTHIKNEVPVQPNTLKELERITEEKLRKYSELYGDLKRLRRHHEEDDLLPVSVLKAVPSTSNMPKRIGEPKVAMNENTRRLIEFAKEMERDDKQKVDNIPTNNITQNADSNISTFIQVGAFKKQLNLQKRNF